jgi:hypothetical protein
MKSDANGKITPCLAITTKSDGCILSSQKVYSLNSSKEKYTIQNKYGNIYKQNEIDFIDYNKNIWFLADEQGYPITIKLDPQGNYIGKYSIFEANDKKNHTITKVLKTKASKDVYWTVLEGMTTNVFVAKDSWTNTDVCNNTPSVKSGGSRTATGGLGSYLYGYYYGPGIAIIGKDYNGQTATRIFGEVYCDQQQEHYYGEGYTGYARITGTNFNAKDYFYGVDKYNSLIVLTPKDLREYYLDSNDVEFPSAIQEIN